MRMAQTYPREIDLIFTTYQYLHIDKTNPSPVVLENKIFSLSKTLIPYWGPILIPRKGQYFALTEDVNLTTE